MELFNRLGKILGTRKVVYINENAKEGIGTIWLEDKLIGHVCNTFT